MLRAVIAVLAACSSNTKVGNQALLNVKEKTGGGFEATTTTAVALGATLPPAQTVPAAATTTAPPARRTATTLSRAQQQAITVTIAIEPDSSLSQFNPSSQSAYPGTPVKWVNHDSKPRSVVSDDGSTFSSALIQPGGSFTWTATAPPRQINYHDGTRPYAVADIVVVAKP